MSINQKCRRIQQGCSDKQKGRYAFLNKKFKSISRIELIKNHDTKSYEEVLTELYKRTNALIKSGLCENIDIDENIDDGALIDIVTDMEREAEKYIVFASKSEPKDKAKHPYEVFEDLYSNDTQVLELYQIEEIEKFHRPTARSLWSIAQRFSKMGAMFVDDFINGDFLKEELGYQMDGVESGDISLESFGEEDYDTYLNSLKMEGWDNHIYAEKEKEFLEKDFGNTSRNRNYFFKDIHQIEYNLASLESRKFHVFQVDTHGDYDDKNSVVPFLRCMVYKIEGNPWILGYDSEVQNLSFNDYSEPRVKYTLGNKTGKDENLIRDWQLFSTCYYHFNLLIETTLSWMQKNLTKN